MKVVEGGFGELALGEVQGLEGFDFGEVLPAGVGDRGGVEVHVVAVAKEFTTAGDERVDGLRQ